MISTLITRLRQAAGLLMLSLNSVLHITPVLIIAVFKALLPVAAVRRTCDHALMALAASWIDVNSWMMRTLTDTQIEVTGLPEPMPDGHCMIISNHQSWVDIPVLQALLNRRLPFMRFFLKSQLIWVPVLGLAWWALDFPFIRAGGTAFVLNAMGDSLDTIVDVTIAYPDGPAELFDLFANRIQRICVHMRTLSLPSHLLGGDYQNDANYRQEFQAWLNQLWEDKDRLMQSMLSAKPS